tara:strand:+ start:1267 stop:1512 length:246 start_codon:yes stop_codon:yes gene_type:complete
MPFTEEPSVRFETINGKQVPVIECETEVVVRNKITGQEYASDVEALQDIENPSTDTQQDHVTRSVKIKVAKMPPLGASSNL